MTLSAFTELKLSQDILSNLVELGFTEMTPIQSQSLPLLMAGQDLIGQSKTGSGKTACFALPVLERINLSLRQPQALILCPTRELCAQVAREVKRFGRKLNDLQTLIVAGGQPARPQVEALQQGVHIVIGTPGRVLDLIKREAFAVEGLKQLVLDEADRMLDMGFEEEVLSILKAMPAQRQTVFFSATFPPTIKKMSQRFQKKPTFIKVEDETAGNADIEHIYYEMAEYEKLPTLVMALQYHQPELALVFCNRKVTVAELYQDLREKRISVSCLHGDLDQKERNEELAKFRNGSTRVLIATDVAARGLDIDEIQLVVNFDLPHQGEDYIHRVGRTGRAGRKGLAITLMADQEIAKLKELSDETEIQFHKMKRDFKHRGGGGDQNSDLSASMRTLYIGGGRKDKLRPGDLLGALTNETIGLSGAQIGKIEIHDQFSYVAVSAARAHEVARRLTDGRIKKRRFFVKVLS